MFDGGARRRRLRPGAEEGPRGRRHRADRARARARGRRRRWPTRAPSPCARSVERAHARADRCSSSCSCSSRPCRSIVLAGDAEAKSIGDIARVPVVMVVFDELPSTSLMDARPARGSTPSATPASRALAAGRHLVPQRARRSTTPPAARCRRSWTGPIRRRRSCRPRPSTPTPSSRCSARATDERLRGGHQRLPPRPLRGHPPGRAALQPAGLHDRRTWASCTPTSSHRRASRRTCRACPTRGATSAAARAASRRALPARARGRATPSPNTRANLNRDRTRALRRLGRRRSRPGIKPSLNFKHTLLPHVPWQYLPDGRLYRRQANDPISNLSRQSYEDEAQFDQLQLRHLLQLGFADRSFAS